MDFGNTFPSKRDDSTYWPSRSLELQSMLSEGFDVTISRGIEKWGISHNKVAVFDGAFALAGSYNWSFTSEDNHFENLFFTDDKKNIAGLQAYWEYLRSLSVPFDQAKAHAWPQTAPTPPRDANPSVASTDDAAGLRSSRPPRTPRTSSSRRSRRPRRSIDVSMFTLTSPGSCGLAAAYARGLSPGAGRQSQHDEDSLKRSSTGWPTRASRSKVNAGPNVDGPSTPRRTTTSSRSWTASPC